MNHWLPTAWHSAAGYIGLMLVVTLLLRCGALLFNVLQARLFSRSGQGHRVSYPPAPDRTPQAHFTVRVREPGEWHGDYPSGDRPRYARPVVGETLSRFLVAVLTLVGTSAILLWMHWQLALLILLFNPLVIYATVQLGKRVKHLKNLKMTARRALPRP